MSDKKDAPPAQGIGLSFDVNTGDALEDAEQRVVAKQEEGEPLLEIARERASELRLLVLAELTPRPAFTTAGNREGYAARLGRTTIDEYLSELDFDLVVELADPLVESGSPVRVDVTPRALKDFRPDTLARSVRPLHALLEARKVVLGATDVDARLKSELHRILERPAWAETVMAVAERTGRSTTSAVTEAEPTPIPGPTNGGTSLERLFEQVDIVPKPSRPEPSRKEGSRLGALISAVAKGERATPTAPPGAQAAAALLERAFRSLLDALLRHEEFHRVERAWRGLALLVERADLRKKIRINAVNVPVDRMPAALTAVKENREAPPDLILADAAVTSSASSLEWLETLAERASLIPAPLLVSGDASLLGHDSLADFARQSRATSQSDDERTLLFRSFCRKPAARWVAIVENGPLVRAAYDATSSRLRDLAFEQDWAEPRSAVFAPAHYVLGALVARCQASLGHPFAPVDPREGRGALSGFSVHELSDRGVTVAIPVEHPVGPDRHDEAARTGVIVLGCRSNRDEALIQHAVMAFRESTPASMKAAGLTLGDQLMVARAATLALALANALPSYGSKGPLETALVEALLELFPNPPPVGPRVEVDLRASSMSVTLRPGRYPGLTLEEVAFSVPRS
ncbi:MAG TPA: type VI secretion system contractile sheath large subunit [Polyangiaceae bacterium]|jgi:type VI secretion system ImpB/VipA family protein